MIDVSATFRTGGLHTSNMAVRKAEDKEIARINFEKEQANKQREAEAIAANQKAAADADRDKLLNQMNQKLDKMKRQNIIDKSQQKYDQLQRDLYPRNNH